MTDKLVLPDALVVRQYRGYRDEQRLDLRPLTLLYGRNNAGKSALLRALPLLADSIRANGGQPLDMAGPVVRGGHFGDLVWRGSAQMDPRLGKVALGLRWPRRAGLDVAFDWPDRRTVSLVGLRVGGETGAWWRERIDRTPPPPGILALEGLSEPARTLHLRRKGLSLTAMDVSWAEIDDVLARWRAFGEQVQWLTASRQLGERVFEYARLSGAARLAPNGQDITGWLVEHPEHRERISAQWYEPHLGAKLEVVERSPVGYSVRLEPVERPGLGVDLLDTGEGNIQVLAVLAALAMAEAGDGPPIVALEEPESHLHPHLQAALAARVREVVEGGRGCADHHGDALRALAARDSEAGLGRLRSREDRVVLGRTTRRRADPSRAGRSTARWHLR